MQYSSIQKEQEGPARGASNLKRREGGTKGNSVGHGLMEVARVQFFGGCGIGFPD